MSHPLSAAYYADDATAWRGPILENVHLARDTFRVRIGCKEIARRIVPGQFVMLRIAGTDDPLLARPLALYDVFRDEQTGEPAGIDLVYLVVGKMTSRLAQLVPGVDLEAWGPLGNGFTPIEAEHVIMAAGGIGQTPFVALGAEYLGQARYGEPSRQAHPASRVTLCYGARRAEYLAGVEDFRRLGVEVELSTDDGSAGHHGLVTDLLDRHLQGRSAGNLYIACCGPEPMMHAVAKLAARHDVRCDLSLETPMACGIGICFSCVAPIRQPDGGWDYKRTCVDGPVFPAEKVAW